MAIFVKKTVWVIVAIAVNKIPVYVQPVQKENTIYIVTKPVQYIVKVTIVVGQLANVLTV